MSKVPQVNYDPMAADYDQRSRLGYLSGVTQALQELGQQVEARHI
jgi:hypothetical protein